MANLYLPWTVNHSQESWDASTTASVVRYGNDHVTQPRENNYGIKMDARRHLVPPEEGMKSNGSYQMTEIDQDIPSEWVVIMGVALGVAVAFLGLIGNAMTIDAYRRNRKLRTSFNFLITNLCTVDLLFSLVIIPIHLPMMIMRISSYGIPFCSFVGYFYYCSLTSSVINLVCIALNRYVGIVHSRRYRILFASDMKKFWLLGIWLSAPLLYFPLLLAGSIRWENYSLRCAITSRSTDSMLFLWYQIALSIALQAIPTVILAVMYRQILQKVKRCRKTVEHFPITNSPSIATSCMLAGGMVGLNTTRQPKSNASSYMDEGCSSEMQTTHIKTRRNKRLRLLSSKKLPKQSSDPHDMREGKKAIIVAYLQVPPASISPRKNPHLLYKRSPPQTRTMVVPEGDSTQGQVCLSATASSPNISDADDQTARATSMTFRHSLTRCGKQRSFSTGDENLEPERGMVGDMEQDLPNLQMLSEEMNEISKYDYPRKKLKSTSVQYSPTADDQMVHNLCEIRVEEANPLYANDSQENAREKRIPILTRSMSLPERCSRQITLGSFGDDEDPISSKNHINIEERCNVDSLPCYSSSRRMHFLTRQQPIDEYTNLSNDGQMDQTTEMRMEPNLFKSSSKECGGSKKIMMTRSCIGLDIPKEQELLNEKKESLQKVMQDVSRDTIFPLAKKWGVGYGDEQYSEDDTKLEKGLKQKRRFLKYTSTSSDKGYASQINDGSYQRADSREIARIPAEKHENVVLNDPVTKKFLVRRGGQMSHGSVRWLKQFRRGKSLSQSKYRSKYRVRGKNGSKQDAVITIVIDDPSTEGNWRCSSPIAKRSSQSRRKSSFMHSEDSKSSCSPIRETTNYPLASSNNEESKTVRTKTGNSQDSNELRCWRALWQKLLSELSPRKSMKDDGCTSNNVEENYVASDGSVECEEDEGISNGTDRSEQDEASLKSTGTSRLLTSPKTSGESTIKKSQLESESGMLTVPQLSVEHGNPFIEREKEITLKTSKPITTDEDCQERRKRFATGCEFQFTTTCNSSEREETFMESHDTDIIDSQECGMLLKKRSEMNASSQYLRVGNTNPSIKSINIETGSMCGDDIGLERRWSGQSDALSIYSGRFLMCSNQPVNNRGSIISNSACSGGSVALSHKNSKPSDSSHGSAKKQKSRSRRKSVYAKWIPKKSSVASSFGSNSSRRRRREAEKRLAYSGLAICMAFAVCVLPMSTVQVLRSTTDLYIYPEIDFGVAVLSWFHAIINPILYGFLNPQYRVEYRKMLQEMWSCLICKRDDSLVLAGRTSKKSQKSTRQKHGNIESQNHQ